MSERESLAVELERLAECEGGVRGGSERAAETMRQAARTIRADTILSPRGEQTEAVARAVSEIIADLKLRGYANLSGDPDWCKEGRAWERIIARHPAGAEAPSVVGAGISDLEQRAFDGANAPQSVEFYQKLVRDLWKAACDGSEITESALAALSPQALGGWQPIETAPRDGTAIEARCGDYAPFECHWDGSRFIHYDPDDGPIAYRPDEWRPLRCKTCGGTGLQPLDDLASRGCVGCGGSGLAAAPSPTAGGE